MFTTQPFSLFTEHDIYLFREGKHYRLYEKFGSHSAELNGRKGVYFAVWAPHATEVSVIGNFNRWRAGSQQLFPRWDGSGIWEGFIEGLDWGTIYKYALRTYQNTWLEKSDPYAVSWEQNVQAASQVSTTWFEWDDAEWMDTRKTRNSLQAPVAVYEMHLGSWMRGTDDPRRFFNYREIAERLIPYLKDMQFTHVEFMPVMEHPYEPSWGYQITGFFAANSRFGSPQDLMIMINELHKNNIGVILDWVPSHFPGDANGLHFFDGTYLYEHEDPRQGYHPQWNSHIFNYGRPEVKSFLISNALFWLDRYHADGLRVDAVTSMLYLDYAREEGQWIPNMFGGNVNLEAKQFLQDFNTAVYREYSDVITIAEESSDFPMLTKPVHDGGIGFGMKWMMGWMHDTLKYFAEDPINRKYHHNKITFASMYMYNENYMMPLSHDEVVHGKASMIYKMPGDEWQKFANLRALYAYMYTHPGAKLLFMGNEFAQTHEWRFSESLDWHLLEHHVHRGMQRYVRDLNHLYRTEKSMYENQFSPESFEWVEANDGQNSIFVYLRKGESEDEVTMTILNLSPRVFEYKIGVNEGTKWNVILNSDDENYGGSGVEAVITDEEDDEWMMRPNAIVLQLPPLAAVVLKQVKVPAIPVPKKQAIKTKPAPEGESKARKTTRKSAATAPSAGVKTKKTPAKKTGGKIESKTQLSAGTVTSPEMESPMNARSVVTKRKAATPPKKTAAPVRKSGTSKDTPKQSIVSAEVVSGTAGEARISSAKVEADKVEAGKKKPLKQIISEKQAAKTTPASRKEDNPGKNTE